MDKPGDAHRNVSRSYVCETNIVQQRLFKWPNFSSEALKVYARVRKRLLIDQSKTKSKALGVKNLLNSKGTRPLLSHGSQVEKVSVSVWASCFSAYKRSDSSLPCRYSHGGPWCPTPTADLLPPDLSSPWFRFCPFASCQRQPTKGYQYSAAHFPNTRVPVK